MVLQITHVSRDKIWNIFSASMSNWIKIESPSMDDSSSIKFTVSLLGQDKGYTVK